MERKQKVMRKKSKRKSIVRSFFGCFRRCPQIAVVRLSGVIGEGGVGRRNGLTLSGLESTIEAAFEVPRLRAVALSINSPGGSPVQSALIAERVQSLAKQKKVKVYAFCDDVAASGGYWLACSADEIYANGASVVGSIGVITSSFGFDKFIKRIGIERRVYTAGKNKHRLDPFLPENENDVRYLRVLQKDLHEQFKKYVRQRRGKRLTGTSRVIFNGDFWSGIKATELGLIDGVGEMRSILKKKYGEDVRFSLIEEKKSFLAKRFGIKKNATGWADELLLALEERALWNKYGL